MGVFVCCCELQRHNLAEAVRKAHDARQDRREELKKFESSYGINRRVRVQSVFANPHAFTGKVIGVKIAFLKMLRQDDGLFGTTGIDLAGIVVSEIPSAVVQQLTDPGSDAILAVEVRGIAPLLVGGNEVRYPECQFLGILTTNAIDEWDLD